jgi:hypothetical protein
MSVTRTGSGRRGAVGSPSHPVADVARRRCREVHPQRAAGAVVACGECWERAIRDDERAVVLFGLPREIEPDPDYVDEVAVELAVAGCRPRLVPAEEAAAVAVLAGRGWSDSRIGQWLGIRHSRVAALRAGSAVAAAVEVGPLRLEREPQEMHAGGSAAYRVLVEDRWVGWVGDGQAWRGWRYGARQWWACWREDGDTAARWSTDLDFATRAAALDALTAQVTAAAGAA